MGACYTTKIRTHEKELDAPQKFRQYFYKNIIPINTETTHVQTVQIGDTTSVALNEQLSRHEDIQSLGNPQNLRVIDHVTQKVNRQTAINTIFFLKLPLNARYYVK